VSEPMIDAEMCRNVGGEVLNAQAMAAGIHALLLGIPDEEMTDRLLSAQLLALQIENKMKEIMELL